MTLFTCFSLCCFFSPRFTYQFTNSGYVITDSGIDVSSTSLRTKFAVLSSFAFFKKYRYNEIGTCMYKNEYLQFLSTKLCFISKLYPRESLTYPFNSCVSGNKQHILLDRCRFHSDTPSC